MLNTSLSRILLAGLCVPALALAEPAAPASPAAPAAKPEMKAETKPEAKPAGPAMTMPKVNPAELASKRLDLLVSFMAGSYATTAQHDADPENYFDIRLHMTPIWTDRTDAKYLYVEQAMAAAQDSPYRQRVYKVTSIDANTFKSEVYELPGDPQSFTGAWEDTTKLKDVSPDKLVAREGCALTLRYYEVIRGMPKPGKPQTGKIEVVPTFEGETLTKDCTSTRPGIKYIHSQSRITSEGLIAWDRGYAVKPDGSGTEVLAMGPEAGGYRFVKQTAATPKTAPSMPQGKTDDKPEMKPEAKTEAKPAAAPAPATGK